MYNDIREQNVPHAAQWTMLEHLFRIMKPFIIATKEVRAEMASLNLILPIMFLLKKIPKGRRKEIKCIKIIFHCFKFLSHGNKQILILCVVLELVAIPRTLQQQTFIKCIFFLEDVKTVVFSNDLSLFSYLPSILLLVKEHLDYFFSVSASCLKQ